LPLIEITVSPGATQTEIVGRHGDGWKVRIRAAPERGRANQVLIEFVADALGVGRDGVRIVGGRTSRRKLVEIDGLDAEEVGRRLEAAAPSSR
jgi:uncharacterized protein (TIGR00251 family)